MIEGRTNTASIIIITHIRRDNDCNGNEKDDSEKQKGGGGGVKN